MCTHLLIQNTHFYNSWFTFQMVSQTTSGPTLTSTLIVFCSSAALPALIRWPIRIFCSLTGEFSHREVRGHLVPFVYGYLLCLWLDICINECVFFCFRSVNSVELGEPSSGNPSWYVIKCIITRGIPTFQLQNKKMNVLFCFCVTGIQGLCKWLSRIWRFIGCKLPAKDDTIICIIILYYYNSLSFCIPHF